jgi:prepilin-type N-terminal cleavage/methylation domain-containing protein/prepilin-type processing-associated H-X9-DG protein
MHKVTRQGFTLIELLVVIAIIAVLMGILMPSLRAAKDNAMRIQCTGNVKTLSLGWTMYATENNNKLVGAMIENASDAKKGGRAAPWVERPSAQNDDIEDKIAAIKRGALWPYIKTEKAYRCPSDRRVKGAKVVAYCSFSIADGAAGEGWFGGFTMAKKLTDIKRPSDKYIFLEDIDTRGFNAGSWVMGLKERRWIDPLAMWHTKRSTMGYADGHAEMHAWKDDSFIDWANGAMEAVLSATTTSTYPALPVPADEPTDYDYMRNNFPCKKLDN